MLCKCVFVHIGYVWLFSCCVNVFLFILDTCGCVHVVYMCFCAYCIHEVVFMLCTCVFVHIAYMRLCSCCVHVFLRILHMCGCVHVV